MDEPENLVEYVPPDADQIRAFARSVCEIMAERTQNPRFVQPEAIHGLSIVLSLAARTQARLLNEEHLVDKDEK